jgi:hypothetical protein
MLRGMKHAPLVALMLAALPVPIWAQVRQIQHHTFDDPEGRLMAFYAAALAVSAVGPGAASDGWSMSGGIELSLIPRLSRRQRTAGFDKPESSNLSPVIPRIRIAISTPGQLRIEGSWLPPITVFDARANLYSLAVSRTIASRGSFIVTPRLAAAGGRARGAITCNDALLRGTPSEQVYYARVCRARESDDHFEPRQLSAEVIVGRSSASRLVPYATVGVRHDDTRFDIGVHRADGTRDPDHPVLVSRTTRPYFAGGATWRAGRTAAGAELYYAPGSLVTVRARFDVLLRAGDASRAR